MFDYDTVFIILILLSSIKADLHSTICCLQQQGWH